jgi:predicted aldo/keto reductase-like oxidoreductase
METRKLGNTGIEVSRLCFGTLTFRQLDTDLRKAADVIIHALDMGVNFVDTAEGYRTYEHVLLAKKARPGFTINTKSPAKTYDDMKKSIEKARVELDADTIDSFLLHGCGGPDDGLKERTGALEALLEAKSKGIIRAIGLSCHYIEGVKQAEACPEIDIVHPLFNILAKGVPDGTREDMEEACLAAHKAGKGIFSMKSLAGGLLIPRKAEAFGYVMSVSCIDSVAVGMTTNAEVEHNIAIFEGKVLEPTGDGSLKPEGLRLHILKSSCIGCGDCVKVCPSGAMSIVDGKATVDRNMCLTCGYCGFACKRFCIRLV